MTCRKNTNASARVYPTLDELQAHVSATAAPAKASLWALVCLKLDFDPSEVSGDQEIAVPGRNSVTLVSEDLHRCFRELEVGWPQGLARIILSLIEAGQPTEMRPHSGDALRVGNRFPHPLVPEPLVLTIVTKSSGKGHVRSIRHHCRCQGASTAVLCFANVWVVCEIRPRVGFDCPACQK